jgi:hypothetical protein
VIHVLEVSVVNNVVELVIVCVIPVDTVVVVVLTVTICVVLAVTVNGSNAYKLPPPGATALVPNNTVEPLIAAFGAVLASPTFARAGKLQSQTPLFKLIA